MQCAVGGRLPPGRSPADVGAVRHAGCSYSDVGVGRMPGEQGFLVWGQTSCFFPSFEGGFPEGGLLTREADLK
jgi:hypothetical protein